MPKENSKSSHKRPSSGDGSEKHKHSRHHDNDKSSSSNSRSHSRSQQSSKDDKYEWPYKDREDYNRYHPYNAIPDIIYVRSPITGEDTPYPGEDVYAAIRLGVSAQYDAKSKNRLPTFWRVTYPAGFPPEGWELFTPLRHYDIGAGDWEKALDAEHSWPMASWPLLVDQKGPSFERDNRPEGHTDDDRCFYVGPEVVWQYCEGWVPLWVGCRWGNVFYDFEYITNPIRPDGTPTVSAPPRPGSDWDQLGGLSDSSEWRHQYAALSGPRLMGEFELPAGAWGHGRERRSNQQEGQQGQSGKDGDSSAR